MPYALANDAFEDPAAPASPESGPEPVMASGPTVARIRLGAGLRRMRAAADLTGEEAARAIHGSHPKISRIEGGKSPVRSEDVAALLDLYGVTDEAVRQEMLGLADLSREDDWWTPLSRQDPRQLTVNTRYLLALEAEASLIFTYESQAIPVLLQTDAYARAAAASLTPNDRRWHRADDRRWRGGLGIRVLARRRGLLKLEEPPRVWVLIQQAALTRVPGNDPAVLRDQLIELREIAADQDRARNIAIQVVPDNVGSALSAPGPFTLLRFDHQDVPTVVLMESMTTIRSSTQPGEVDHYQVIFDRLAIEALQPRASVELLDQLIRQMTAEHDAADTPDR